MPRPRSIRLDRVGLSRERLHSRAQDGPPPGRIREDLTMSRYALAGLLAFPAFSASSNAAGSVPHLHELRQTSFISTAQLQLFRRLRRVRLRLREWLLFRRQSRSHEPRLVRRRRPIHGGLFGKHGRQWAPAGATVADSSTAMAADSSTKTTAIAAVRRLGPLRPVHVPQRLPSLPSVADEAAAADGAIPRPAARPAARRRRPRRPNRQRCRPSNSTYAARQLSCGIAFRCALAGSCAA